MALSESTHFSNTYWHFMIKIFTFSKKKIFFMDIYNSAVFKLLKSWFKNIQMQKNTAEIISARNSQNTSFSQCRETCKCLIRFYSIFLKYGALIGDNKSTCTKERASEVLNNCKQRFGMGCFPLSEMHCHIWNISGHQIQRKAAVECKA